MTDGSEGPSAEPAPVPVRVGIALIGRAGAFLIRQRPPLPGSPMPGKWEFAGGKVEAGETPAEAAAREGCEEVGTPVVVGRLDRRTTYHYPHGLVELWYYHARLDPVDAEPSPGSGFRWVRAEDLSGYEFPPANDALIADLAAGRGVGVP